MSIVQASATGGWRFRQAFAAGAAAGGSTRAAQAIWATIAALVAAVAILFPVLGLSLSLPDLARSLGLSLAALACAFLYTVLRPDERLARLFRALPELVLITYFGGALSYALTAMGQPLWDGTFDAWDKAIGFDWKALLTFYAGYPAFYRLLAFAYYSMLPQMAVLVVALITVRAFRAADRFILGFAFAAVITMAISAFVPALCAGYVYRDAVAEQHVLQLSWNSIQQVEALRSGVLRVISMAQAEGLVTFPSFHAATAMLLMFGFWHVPYLRWPGLALNMLMIAATPIEGGHYLVDIFAGIAIAILAHAAAARLLRPGQAKGG